MTAAEGTRRLSFGERFARAAAVFLDPRVLIILLLGFSSGLPLALSGSTLLGNIAVHGASPQREFSVG